MDLLLVLVFSEALSVVPDRLNPEVPSVLKLGVALSEPSIVFEPEV